MREPTGIRSELHYDGEIRRDNDDCLYQMGIVYPNGETEWGTPSKYFTTASCNGWALSIEDEREEARAWHRQQLSQARVGPPEDYPIKFVWRRVWNTYGTERGIA